MQHWPFPDGRDTRVITLESIIKGRPVLFVEHLPAGGWLFFDGRTGFNQDDFASATLGQLLDGDPTLAQLADMPAGWRASRETAGGVWERETRAGRERTRARAAAMLAEIQRTRKPLPPGAPTSVEILRELRGGWDE